MMADAFVKKQVLGSIYREKLRFDGKEYRTPKLNESAKLIYQINKTLRHKKKRERLQAIASFPFSTQSGTILEPIY